MAEITEELRVLVTAEVDKAVKELNKINKGAKSTEKLFKKLGGAISAAFSVKAVAQFAADSLAAYSAQTQAVNILNSTISATGAASWTTGKKLQDMASALQKVTNYGDETILSMQSVLLGFKSIKGDNFEHATKAILDMSTVMGMDLKSAAQTVGKALDDPINGLDSLRRQGFYFTESQKQMIQSMLEAGDAAGAQKLILEELDSVYGGSAEAAKDFGTQIKNAWGDMQEGVGKFISMWGNSEDGNNLVSLIEAVADSLSNFHSRFRSETRDYQVWYDSLSSSDKLAEAQSQLAYYAEQEAFYLEQIEKAQTDNEKIIAEGFAEAFRNDQQRWIYAVTAAEKQVRLESQIASERESYTAALSDAETLLGSISAEYEKLSSSDPEIQIQKYRKQLEQLAKDRETITNINPELEIDTSDALSQIEYIEKAIRLKIEELSKDGKKSWREWWQDITGIEQDSFTNGRDAGKKYVEGLENALESARKLSAVLGNDFDFTRYLSQQEDDIRNIIETLLTIPAEQIDEIFNTWDGSIDELIKKYESLKKSREDSEKSDTVIDILNELESQVNSLGKSERELTLERLRSADATEKEIEEADRLFDLLDEQKNTVISWDTFIEDSLDSLLDKLHVTSSELKSSLVSLGVALTKTGINAAMTGFEEFGKALGEGKDSADAMHSALASMAQEILNNLPNLFLQAGLQLIATPGMWPIGLGFIAAAGSTALINGFTQGYTDSLSENADGGVFGDAGYSAFAKGGAFTNAIVQSPTYFKFAKGSSFGLGLMGEAGPEAVMPLLRSADGSLGVRASVAGESDSSLIVVINNYGNEEVKAQESTDNGGNRKLEITIGTMINSHLSGGKADKALKSRYGLTPKGV